MSGLINQASMGLDVTFENEGRICTISNGKFRCVVLGRVNIGKGVT